MAYEHGGQQTQKTQAVPSLDERQKRMAVFAKARKTVLVKLYGIIIPGLAEKGFRDEETIDAKHEAEAQKRDLNFRAYRDKGDTGFALFNNEHNIRITGLVSRLDNLGLYYTGGHVQHRVGKSSVSVLQFSTKGEAQPMTAAVLKALTMKFSSCTLWCNLKYNHDGEGQYRLDTINLNGGAKTDKPGRELTVEGNTYRIG